MKPTKIIKEPTRVRPKLGEHGTNTTHPILLITCDDGRDYTITQLAQVLSMTRQKLSYQIMTLGWDHPRVLDWSYGKLPSRPPLGGNDAWRRLSDEPRGHRLACIPRVGIMERGF